MPVRADITVSCPICSRHSMIVKSIQSKLSIIAKITEKIIIRSRKSSVNCNPLLS